MKCLLLILLFLVPVLGEKIKDASNIIIMTTCSLDGKTEYLFQIPRWKLEMLSDWSPTLKTIPLLPQRAVQLALSKYNSLFPMAKLVTAAGLALNPIQNSHLKKWFYCIILTTSENNRKTLPGRSYSVLVVLLDGTVITPVRTKSKSRICGFR